MAQMKDTGASSKCVRPFLLVFLSFFHVRLYIYRAAQGERDWKYYFQKYFIVSLCIHLTKMVIVCSGEKKKLQSVCLPPLQFSNRGSVQKSDWKCVHLEWPPPRAVPSDEVRGAVLSQPEKNHKSNSVLKNTTIFFRFLIPLRVMVLYLFFVSVWHK